MCDHLPFGCCGSKPVPKLEDHIIISPRCDKWNWFRRMNIQLNQKVQQGMKIKHKYIYNFLNGLFSFQSLPMFWWLSWQHWSFLGTPVNVQVQVKEWNYSGGLPIPFDSIRNPSQLGRKGWILWLDENISITSNVNNHAKNQEHV